MNPLTVADGTVIGVIAGILQWELGLMHGFGEIVIPRLGSYKACASAGGFLALRRLGRPPTHSGARAMGPVSRRTSMRAQGEFRSGKREGHGLSLSSDGLERYDGFWRDDQRHGYGVCKYRSNATYFGDWAGNQRHGHGVMVYANGDRFCGRWSHDRCHGYGIHKAAESSGEVYCGLWQDDARHGPGRLFDTHGTFIEARGPA